LHSSTYIACHHTHHPPLQSTLFPYTTLFRSRDDGERERFREGGHRYSAARSTNPHRRFVPRALHDVRDFDGNRMIHLRPVRFGSDRKSTRLNSSHQIISYAVFCLKKKKYSEM